jgi:pimeloyl-ACP methyl ester carboxylesterase
MKKLRWIGLGVLVLFAALAVLLVQGDVPAATAEKRWTNAASRFVSLPSGARVHYRDEGNPYGPVLVLLHGSSASLHTWESWVTRLSDDFRVITLDLPGHGLTGPVPSGDYGAPAAVAFLEEFLATLKLERVNLGGNSFGGFLAWRYALAHPERVEKLVLVNSAGYFTGPVPLPFRLAKIPVVKNLLLYVSPRFLVEDSLRQLFPLHPEKVTVGMLDRYHDLLLREGNREATLVRLNTPLDFAASRERLQALKMPTLILWGSKDAWIPVETARLFHEHIPGSTLKIYEGAGHVPMEEIPDESAADVRAFLAPSAPAVNPAP